MISRSRRLAPRAILALLWIGCAEVQGPASETLGKSLEGLIVSESQPAATTSASTINTSQLSVTYVSLTSGTLPQAVSVRIRNRTTGVTDIDQIPVIAGGFDPVAIQAKVDDVLELTATLSNGSVETFSARVPLRRPPAIVRTNPPRGRTDVALTIRPVVIFSEPVDPTTLSNTSVRLLQGTTPVASTVALEPGSAWSVEITPTSPLQPSTVYELIVTQNIRDLDGDPLDAMVTSTFTTIAVNPVVDPSIAFVSNRDGSNYIYVASADGSRVMQLTPGEKPAWSWDGRRIAFQRAGAIYRMNADGSDLTLLGQGLNPAWSPDGTQIAFDRGPGYPNTGGGIFLMNADGSAVRKLIITGFENDDFVESPTWSPDGRFIAFIRAVPYYSREIYIMNADGSQPKPLIGSTDPAWSPDGSTIAFNYTYGIGAISVDGSGLRYVTEGSLMFDPDWSPDARQILFHRFSGPPVYGSPYGSRTRIYRSAVTNASIQQLIPDAASPALVSYSDQQAAWSRVNR